MVKKSAKAAVVVAPVGVKAKVRQRITALAGSALRVTLISMRVMLGDRKLAVYALLMIAWALVVVTGVHNLYSYQNGALVQSAISALGLANFSDANPFYIPTIFIFLMQMLMAVPATYINLAMLEGARQYVGTKKDSFFGNLAVMRVYFKATAIWVALFYGAIFLYDVLPAFVFPGTKLNLELYLPGSIPVMYVLLEIVDKNVGPVQFSRGVVRGALESAAKLTGRTPAYHLLAIVGFIAANLAQIVFSVASVSVLAPNFRTIDSAFILSSLVVAALTVIVNVFSLVSYDYFKGRME